LENLEHHDGAELIVKDLIRDLNRLNFLNDLAIEKAQSEPNFAESILLSTLRKIDDFIFTTKGLASIPNLFALSVLEMITFHKNVALSSISLRVNRVFASFTKALGYIPRYIYIV